MKTAKTEQDIFELLGVPSRPKQLPMADQNDGLYKAALQHLQQLSAYEKIRDEFTAQIAEINEKRDCAIQLIDMAVSLGNLLKIPLKQTQLADTASVPSPKQTATQTEVITAESAGNASLLCGSRGRAVLNIFYKENPKDPGSVIMDHRDVSRRLGKSEHYFSVWLAEIKRAGVESPFEKVYIQAHRPSYKLSTHGIELAKMFDTEEEKKNTTARAVYKMENGVITRSQVRDHNHLVGGKTHRILSLFREKNPENPEMARLYERDIMEAHGVVNNDTYFSSWMNSHKKKGNMLLTRDTFALPSRGRHSMARPYKLTTAGVGLLMVLETLEKKQNEK